MRYYHKSSRKPRRLAGYDYRSEGLYFITICTKDRQHHFGEIVAGKMHLSDAGIIAHDYWQEIPGYNTGTFLGEFVVMPNHIHGIIGIERTVAPLQCNGTTSKNQYMAGLSPKKNSVSRIIGNYKSACTRMIHAVSMEPFGWQPRFHDRIIRNGQELLHIEDYIINNPANWNEDLLSGNTHITL